MRLWKISDTEYIVVSQSCCRATWHKWINLCNERSRQFWITSPILSNCSYLISWVDIKIDCQLDDTVHCGIKSTQGQRGTSDHSELRALSSDLTS